MHSAICQRQKDFPKKDLTHFPPFTEARAKQRFLHTCALCIVGGMDTRTGMILPEQHVPLGQRRHFVRVHRDLTHLERCDAQIKLYAPCACGSGKKFKFCCKRP